MQLPDCLCDYSELIELKLDYNYLQNMPNRMHMLKNLEVLWASQNNLRYFPSNLTHLSKLTQLVLNDNKLDSVPHSVGNLTSLQRLLLHNNPLTELPTSLAALSDVKELSLDWLAYLHNDLIQGQVKHLKGIAEEEPSLKKN